MPVRMLSLVTAVLAAPLAAAAQSLQPVPAGTRVRVTAPTVHREVATVAAFTTDTIFVAPERAPGDTVAIPLDHLQRLEVSAGRKRDTWHGAGIGALAGAVAGAVVGVATYRSCEGSGRLGCFDLGPIGSASAMAVLGAAAGGVVGGIIGSTRVSEHWRRIPISVAVAPVAGGRIALAAAVPLRGW